MPHLLVHLILLTSPPCPSALCPLRPFQLRGLGDPPFVRRFFRCGFLNPEGGIGIAGLYLCPLLPCLAATFPHITRKVPHHHLGIDCTAKRSRGRVIRTKNSGCAS